MNQTVGAGCNTQPDSLDAQAYLLKLACNYKNHVL